MRFIVTTPVELIATVENVRHVRAEDATGSFGILPGHADFVTVLPVSVVSWRNVDGQEGFVLIRGGVLSVRDGNLVEIAARGAFRENELGQLRQTMLEELRRSDEGEENARRSEARIHLATMRQIERVLNAARASHPYAPSLQPGEAPATEGSGGA
ncbi:F0F1 ATP synthase subunit epsilon [Stappia sp. GBMRC 2046]|uniref:ATP synthase epsilon chain n=1 Tax=Stappia sediminis TaxID=2692190 RepID=A0A7X3S9X2_9HYPH|nr:F0F1 ATP synthase subunit epsilon [Stappia sediminis]MXN67289.1 F0F1 ATP synthase subunit epsilon [Stappia sediminis]